MLESPTLCLKLPRTLTRTALSLLQGGQHALAKQVPYRNALERSAALQQLPGTVPSVTSLLTAASCVKAALARGFPRGSQEGQLLTVTVAVAIAAVAV